ncbi:hypothetical protein ACFYRN_25185 [Streptomyces sp. NPDC005227]|uniref:hypothetical protein n=1 Tax=Streptomyces sp. NPDC005227 TaxID=3364707 RepID=UPI00368CA1A0
MIAYTLGAVGVLSSAAVAYYAAPAARGAHRLVLPRRKLLADIRRLEKEADAMVCNVNAAITDAQTAHTERAAAWKALGKAERLVGDLEQQLADRAQVLDENTRLQAELDNARSIRQLSAERAPADDASALPDDVQEFVNATADAWHASA